MVKQYANNIVRIEHYGSPLEFIFQSEGHYSYKKHYYKHDELMAGLPLDTLKQHKSNKLEETDRVYFTKSSSIPRYKLKEFLDSTKLKLNKTNRIDMADTYVISINAYIDNIYSRSSGVYNKYYEVPLEQVWPYTKANFKKEATNKNITTVLIDEHRRDDIIKHFNIDQYPLIKILAVGNAWGDSKVNDLVESFVYLANKTTPYKLVLDETLIETCNEGMIIDEEIYQNLRNMLHGNNKDNINLAMEIMSNSDFTKSQLYILLLLNEFGTKFRSVTKTTNYQSLLNYFTAHAHSALYSSWDQFAGKMMYKFCKTDDEKDIVKRYIIECFNRFLKSNNTKLKIEDLTLC